MNNIIGIYKITNKINNKSYIGQSWNVNERLYEHTRIKNIETLKCPKLYNAIKKYRYC